MSLNTTVMNNIFDFYDFTIDRWMTSLSCDITVLMNINVRYCETSGSLEIDSGRSKGENLCKNGNHL